MAEASMNPWPHDEAPTEAGLEALLREEGLSPDWWQNSPHDRYTTHQHTYHKVLYCLRGSITFLLPETDERFDLKPGDRLDIPPRTPHSALVGSRGVRCVEAPRWET
jgi:mannose-6-phosphate isomerase-like protein (cupin superfamily)